jgi:ketosteroid isomerase-like protein
VSKTGEEVVRDAFAQWNSGDRRANPETIAADVEIHSQLANRVFRGHDGVLEWSREIDEHFIDWRVRIDEMRAVGEGVFVVEGGVTGQGRGSGVPLEQPASWTAEVRDGLLVKLVNFMDRDGAARSVEAGE